MITRLVVISIGLLMSAAVFSAVPVSYFTVKVLDENGAPIEGVVVEGGFSNLKRDYVPGPGVRAITDAKGEADIFGPAYFYVDIVANKEGFYKSKKSVSINIDKDQDVSILLRKKRNPIAMYAKKIKLDIPERGREYGFDFFKGSLVLPGLDGSQADLTIRFDRDLVDNNNFTQTVTLSFASRVDGVVKMEENKEWRVSDFKTAYFAPNNGYTSSMKLIYKRGASGVSKENVGISLFMRIRSSEDKEGNVDVAYYCKISPGISLYGVLADEPSLKLTYYCNPTPNDRNLEFDPKQNLLKNLKHNEKVGTP